MTGIPVRRVAQAIVNIFETGSPAGDYSKVTLLAGDTGHLTYGRAQTTLASGNLHLLIKAYVAAPGALFATALSDYLGRLAACDRRLDKDDRLHWILRQAGDDPVMQDVQDDFFDRVYWRPAAAAAARLGIETPLGQAVIYDGHIHGSWSFIRDRVEERHGSAEKLGEKKWVAAYVKERKDWLSSHANRLLRRTIYRMEVFETLMQASRWELRLPLTIRGVRIDEDALGLAPPLRVSAEGDTARTLHLMEPPMRGEDVRALERALIADGYAINESGLFDERLARIVKDFQTRKGLNADGIAGPATRAELGI